jgi:hypothetical protein
MDNYTKNCPGCGREIDLYTLVCPHCGQMFAVHYSDDRALYIQDNTSYYFRKFNMMNSSGSLNSWNWCAFLFCEAWLIYRKMYKEAIIITELSLALTAFTLMFSLPAIVTSLFTAAISIFVGLRGNSMYMHHVDKLVTNGTAMPPYEKELYAQKAGGTSWLNVIVLALATAALDTVITNIFM